MADRTEALANLISGAINAATAGLRADMAGVVARLAEFEARALVTDRDVGTTRERIAGLEARASIQGPPGADGLDGFACDELVATQDPADDRIVTLSYRRGEIVKSIATLRLPIPAYREVYHPGRTYGRGDLVTWAGSLWYCHASTTARPGNGAPEWTLAVKAGRDGRDLRAEAS